MLSGANGHVGAGGSTACVVDGVAGTERSSDGSGRGHGQSEKYLLVDHDGECGFAKERLNERLWFDVEIGQKSVVVFEVLFS